jgi:hypothetical protein
MVALSVLSVPRGIAIPQHARGRWNIATVTQPPAYKWRRDISGSEQQVWSERRAWREAACMILLVALVSIVFCIRRFYGFSCF